MHALHSIVLSLAKSDLTIRGLPIRFSAFDPIFGTRAVLFRLLVSRESVTVHQAAFWELGHALAVPDEPKITLLLPSLHALEAR